MARCPKCGKEISNMNVIWRDPALEEVFWDDDGLVFKCPVCCEDVGYNEADAEKILKS